MKIIKERNHKKKQINRGVSNVIEFPKEKMVSSLRNLKNRERIELMNAFKSNEITKIRIGGKHEISVPSYAVDAEIDKLKEFDENWIKDFQVMCEGKIQYFLDTVNGDEYMEQEGFDEEVDKVLGYVISLTAIKQLLEDKIRPLL